jgi:hypothetical protein
MARRSSVTRSTFSPERRRKSIEPEVTSTRRRMPLATVVLPHPDSPTSPSVSPSSIANETPSTAFDLARAPQQNAAVDRVVDGEVLDREQGKGRRHRGASALRGPRIGILGRRDVDRAAVPRKRARRSHAGGQALGHDVTTTPAARLVLDQLRVGCRTVARAPGIASRTCSRAAARGSTAPIPGWRRVVRGVVDRGAGATRAGPGCRDGAAGERAAWSRRPPGSRHRT